MNDSKQSKKHTTPGDTASREHAASGPPHGTKPGGAGGGNRGECDARQGATTDSRAAPQEPRGKNETQQSAEQRASHEADVLRRAFFPANMATALGLDDQIGPNGY